VHSSSRPNASAGPDALADRLQHEPRLDCAAAVIDGVADRVASPRRRGFLRGEWLGHALHPAMTDLPLGCWIGATVAEITGDRRGAGRLMLAGVVTAIPTVATGLAEWRTIPDDERRRLGAVHAGGAALTTTLYAWSWWRHLRHPWRAAPWSVLAGLSAVATGWLGGHLGLVAGVGGGRRSHPHDAVGTPAVSDPSAA